MTEVMKMMRFTIALYLCLLFSGQMLAQSALPTSLQPYAHRLPSTVVTGLRQLGYATPEQQRVWPAASVAQRSDALRLDSTKTFYQYNFPGDSTPLYRTYFTYPATNQQVEEEAVFENGTWRLTSRATTTFDQLDRITNVDAVVFDSLQQTFIPDSKLEAFPHANSETLLDSFFVWQWNPDQNDWLLLIANRNFYDAQDNLLEAYSIFNAFGQWLDLKEVYTYDTNGDNTQTDTYVLFDGVEIPIGITETEYNNHLAIQTTEFALDENGATIPERKTEFLYTALNQLEISKTYELNVEWTLTNEQIYSYDAQQRQTGLENRYYLQDGFELRDKTAYNYLQGDDLAVEETYTWNEFDGFLLDERKYYYYSGGASSVEQPATAVYPLVVFPNPANNWVTLQLAAPATVEVYNAMGQWVRATSVEANDQIGLGDLPNGLYYVRARTEEGVYSGQILKASEGRN